MSLCYNKFNMTVIFMIVGALVGFFAGVVLGYALSFLFRITKSDTFRFLNLSFAFVGLCACSFVGSVIAYNSISVLPYSDERESNLGWCAGIMVASLCFLPGAFYGQMQNE